MRKLFFEHSLTCGHYHLKDSSDLATSHLACFLTDDVGCHANKFYKEWLNNPSELEGGGNYSHLVKIDGNVQIWFEIDWFEETPGAEYLEIPITELNYILDRWQEACQKKPKKIIITIDQGKANVEFED